MLTHIRKLRVDWWIDLLFYFFLTHMEKKPDPLKIGTSSSAGPDLSLSPPAVRPKEATSKTTWTVRTDLTSKGSFPLNGRLSLTIISLLAALYGNVCFLEPNRFHTISFEFCLSLAVGFLRIGVSKTREKSPFFLQKNGGVYKMKNN